MKWRRMVKQTVHEAHLAGQGGWYNDSIRCEIYSFPQFPKDFLSVPYLETTHKCYLLWWLILPVNLIGTWGAQTLGISFWVHLWECFWLRLTCWIGRLGEAHCPPSCVWASSSQWKTWTEQKDWIRGNSACLTVELGHLSSLLLTWNFYHQLSWVSSLPASNLRTSGLRNHVNQFLIVNTYPIGFVSLENPD